jgi:hypothetical protein
MTLAGAPPGSAMGIWSAATIAAWQFPVCMSAFLR